MGKDPTSALEHADAVVEFGDKPETGRPAPAWAGVADAPRRALNALRRDHRVVPVIAALAAVAGVASLLGEWQVATLRNSESPVAPTLRVTAGVAALGGFGTAYLVGMLALTACVSLALFGSAAIRVHARVVGLGLAGGVGAVLFATVAQIDQLGTPFNGYLQWGFSAPPEASTGRGVEAAFAAVGLATLALFLATRMPLRTGAAAGTPRTPEAADPRPAASHDGWRRPRGEPDRAEAAEPSDLTVGPATPFAHVPDDRV
jgi:hypothetical protein